MKTMLKNALLVFLSLFITYGLSAQILKDNSKWTFEAKKINGDKYELIVHLKLPDQWHIYSLKPGGDGSLISPSFTFAKNSKVTLTGVLKEKGKLISKTFDGVDGIVHMYINKVDYVQTATISGNTTIKGTYAYQICNESTCLPPTYPANFSIVIKDAGGSTEADTESTAVVSAVNKTIDSTAVNSAIKNDGTVIDTSADKKNKRLASDTKPKPQQQSLILLFFISLGGGLLAVITPCVFSMIPITVSFFTKRSKTRKEGIRNAVYYSLSIIIIFTVFGLVIS